MFLHNLLNWIENNNKKYKNDNKQMKIRSNGRRRPYRMGQNVMEEKIRKTLLIHLMDTKSPQKSWKFNEIIKELLHTSLLNANKIFLFYEKDFRSSHHLQMTII